MDIVSVIEKTVVNASGRCTNIGTHAFVSCPNLVEADFPDAVAINYNAFSNCYKLASTSFPAATVIFNSAFNACRSLPKVYFPAVTTIYDCAFMGCNSLSVASFPAVTSIGSSAFMSCSKLTELYLLGSHVPTLKSTSTFAFTPLYNYSYTAGKWGSIYVRESLYSSFIKAKNWSDASIKARIVSLTDAQIAALG